MTTVNPSVPFRLRLPKEMTVDGNHVVSKEFHVRGIARLEPERLVLEWSGTVDVADVRGGSVRALRESLPTQRVAVGLRRISRLQLRGRWWRPRIELSTLDLAVLDPIPGALPGSVTLALSRGEWRAAEELVASVQLEMADAALREAEQPRELPRQTQDER
jgi:hypothetical protein